MLITNIDKTGAFIGIDTFGPFYFYAFRLKANPIGIVSRSDATVSEQIRKLNHIKRQTCI